MSRSAGPELSISEVVMPVGYHEGHAEPPEGT
jgi:hypothetical protein